jgi:hypothetical protein
MTQQSLGCDLCRGLTPPRGARCRACGRAGLSPRHECHADGCSVEVPPRMLMCLRHWRMVPRDIQKRVWAEYNEGQEIRKDPTEEYMDVQREAVEAVAKKEGRR